MLRRVLAVAAGCGACLLAPAVASAAPPQVHAWYVYATTPAGLQATVENQACNFAQHHPGGNRVLMLDFGSVRKVDSNTWGVYNFSRVQFTNPQVLDALKAAANGHHRCYTGVGKTVVTYGTNNSSMIGMSSSDVWYAGYYQEYRAAQLASYQAASGYNRQSAAAGSDMEPSWAGAGITKQLVNGASAYGYSLYYNFGSADGCPSSGSGGSCNNGWSVADVAYVAYHGVAVALPEIYYTVNANQWTVVRRNWDANHSSLLHYWGTTATTIGLDGPAGWNALSTRNPGRVLNELICFC